MTDNGPDQVGRSVAPLSWPGNPGQVQEILSLELCLTRQKWSKLVKKEKARKFSPTVDPEAVAGPEQGLLSR